MRRSRYSLFAGATLVAALLIAVPSPAHACSMIPPVSAEGVQASLTGDPIPDQDRWLLDDRTVTGFVEFTVPHAWEATLDYEAASAEIASRAWGTVDGRLLHGRVVGGQARGPFVGVGPCGPVGASPVGQHRHAVITDGGGSHAVDGPMSADLEALLTATFGDPDVFDAPQFDDRHPSYEREAYGWQSYLTWGRIIWTAAAVLFVPVAAFGVWLYSTRRH